MNSFIGQEHIINYIKFLKDSNTIPGFIILTGNKSMGKTFLSLKLGEIIAEKNVIYIDGKIDTIRLIVDDSYKAVENTIYIIDDFENMSNNAKNALLMVTEDCPRRAYFMLVGTNISRLPLTLQNRAYKLTMLPYNLQDLMFYAKQAGEFKESEINLLLEICDTPAEINYFKQVNIAEFYMYIKGISTGFSRLSGVESFRLNEKIRLKKDQSGYDLLMVMKKVNKLILNAMINNKINLETGYKIISTTIANMGKLNTNSANKSMIFDSWLLDLREIYR